MTNTYAKLAATLGAHWIDNVNPFRHAYEQGPRLTGTYFSFLVRVFVGLSFQQGPSWPQLSGMPYTTVGGGVMLCDARRAAGPTDRATV